MNMKLKINENALRVSLVAVTFLFGILSIALIALGIVYLNELNHINVYLLRNFKHLPKLLIILGSLSFLASIAGCYFSRVYNERFLKVYIGCLTILLALELVISSIAFFNVDNSFKNGTNTVMNTILVNGGSDKEDFHKLEETYECCGVDGIYDYVYDKYKIPEGTFCQNLIETEDLDRISIDGCASLISGVIERMALESGLYTAVCAIFQIVEIFCLLIILFNE